MATMPCDFDILLSKNVPHIVETIFFSLDYESFKMCMEVNKNWNKLLMAESFLKQFEEEISNDGEKLWHAAQKGNKVEVRKLLLSGIVDVNYMHAFFGSTPLIVAEDKYVVQLLLNGGADPNKTDESGRTLLYWAARHSFYDVVLVQLLLDRGADPNKGGSNAQTPLYWAARGRNGFKKVAQLLLDRGADPNKEDTDGQTPLHWAARYHYKDVVQLLLDRGADPNKEDKDGQIPLHWAARYPAQCSSMHFQDVVQLLLAPLYWAARYPYKDVVQLLLDKGAEPNKADGDGETPLHYSARNGYKYVVQFLLDRGAEPNKADGDGQTPLYRAVRNGCKEMVQLLLERGADPNKGDNDGNTPLQEAARIGRSTDMVELLQNNNGANNHGSTPFNVAIAYSTTMWSKCTLI